MKILMASHYFVSHKGGIEVVANHLFRAFTERGHEIVWMASGATPPPEPAGKSRAVPLSVFNFVEDSIGLPFPIPTLGALATLFREVRKSDILILHDCLYLSNIAAFLIARLHKIPAIIIQHTRFFPNDTGLANTIIRIATAIVTRPMLSRAQQVVFIAQTTRNFFGQVRFVTPPKVIFNGVDTEMFRSVETTGTRAALRHEYGLPDDGTVILFVGRFVEKKGLLAMKHMAEMRPEWTWAFAGWGPLNPVAWNADNVRVFSGLSGPSMARLYRCCNMLVLPSCGEGFPLVVQEALASGLPVVCGEDTVTADPDMRAFVRGAPVDVGSSERTAHEFLLAISDTLAMETQTPGAAERRQAFATLRYSWDRAAKSYLEIIAHLQSRGRSDDAPVQANAEGDYQ